MTANRIHQQGATASLPGKGGMKRSVLWNSFGSGMNALFYTILLMVVNRIRGAEDGGLFASAYAVAMLMWTIGNFETMTYQATDVRNRYAFSNYIAVKIFLCILMMLAALITVLLRGQALYPSLLCLLFCLYKALEAFSDVFYANFQKRERLDLGGFSMALRTMLAMVAFTLGLIFTESLAVSLLLACAVTLLWIFLFDLHLTQRVDSPRPVFDRQAFRGILGDCFPLFLSAFLLMYLTNLPKYTIDRLFDPVMQDYFSTLFMPASFINLVSIFAFRPLLTSLADAWQQSEKARFSKIALRLYLLIAGLTLLAVAAAGIVGIPVLSFLYHVDLTAYRQPLMIIMAGGGFSACITFSVNMLTSMRYQRRLLLGYLLSVIPCRLLSDPLVTEGMTGAALLYLLAMGLTAVALLGVVRISMSTQKT